MEPLQEDSAAASIVDESRTISEREPGYQIFMPRVAGLNDPLNGCLCVLQCVIVLLFD